jgi:gliding motility-associated-like protein
MKVFLLIIFNTAFAAICMNNSAFCQNCSGVVSNGQNLVINGDFSQGYTGWTHDPAYTVFTPCNSCYSVPGRIYAGANPNNFNHAFSNQPDHSATSDSRFLMVDGICQTGINLWSQSNIPIVPNTNYFFSVWITSLDNTFPYGTLRFDINGSPLGTTISAPGIPGTWVKFTAFWNSGPNPPTSVTISIQNTTTTGCDTAVDFGVDDISFSPGCEFGTPGPLPNLGADFSICTKTVPFNINPQFNAATAASNNVRYTWYKNGIAQDTGFGSPFYNYAVTSAGTYAVCVDSGGSCPRTDILTILPAPVSNAGNDQKVCNAAIATLNGNAIPSGATGTWSIVSGTGHISNIHDSASTVTGIGAGDLVLSWTISDSPCPLSSSTVTIHRDTLSVPALTGASFDTCAFTTGLNYSTLVDQLNTHYSWMTTGTLVITSPANTNSVTVDIGSSGGTITVTDTNGACVLSAAKEITISPNVSPALAGIDQMPCLDSTFLMATAPQVGKGHWTVNSGTGIFKNASDPLSVVSGLSNGVNIFIWTVTGCGGPLTDTVTIDVGISNILLSQPTGPVDTLCVGTPRILSVFATGGSGFYNYVWSSSDHSFKTVTDLSSVSVEPASNTSTYFVYAEDSKNYGCRSKGDSVVVHSLIKQDLTMNNLVTPNNDKRNDLFIVHDIETLKEILPGAKLNIYNQWGAKIYQSDSYDNSWGAKDMEDGIYYYHLKTGCGAEIYKGWVQIIR